MKTHALFSPIKNEVDYIGYHAMAFYPYVDKFVWADGNSTDGTIELMRFIKEKYDPENKIVFLENKDCDIYGQSYVDLYNELLNMCKTDLVSYIHPDMIPINPEAMKSIESDDESLRWKWKLLSFTQGRNHVWSNENSRATEWIMTSVNDLGLHYYGYYGDLNEDMYFSEITGDEHILPSAKGRALPYKIGDTGVLLHHYCDSKPYERRYEKMLSVMKNHQSNMGNPDIPIEEQAKRHPRVTCEDGDWNDIFGNQMKFRKIDYTGVQPEVFEKYKEFEQFKRGGN